MLDMHFGTIPGESTASTTAQRYGLFTSSNPGFQFQVTPQEIWAIMCGGSNMVIDPSAHPHHLNIVNHVYVLDMLLGTILQVSLHPQPLHNGMVWCPAVTQDFNQLA